MTRRRQRGQIVLEEPTKILVVEDQHRIREFALLEIFMPNVGRILSRKLICEKCWSSHYDHEANLLDVYMSRLRAKFESIPGPPVFTTVRGVGYQLL